MLEPSRRTHSLSMPEDHNLFKKQVLHGTSLVVQWLRLMFPMQVARVLSLVGEIKFHMLHSEAKKKKDELYGMQIISQFKRWKKDRVGTLVIP